LKAFKEWKLIHIDVEITKNTDRVMVRSQSKLVLVIAKVQTPQHDLEGPSQSALADPSSLPGF
jgi:hypothetical protein